MPGRPKNARKSYLSKKARYHLVTDKDPVTGKLPEKEVIAEEDQKEDSETENE
jgi:hypothetical protein